MKYIINITSATQQNACIKVSNLISKNYKFYEIKIN